MAKGGVHTDALRSYPWVPTALMRHRGILKAPCILGSTKGRRGLTDRSAQKALSGRAEQPGWASALVTTRTPGIFGASEKGGGEGSGSADMATLPPESAGPHLQHGRKICRQRAEGMVQTPPPMPQGDFGAGSPMNGQE